MLKRRRIAQIAKKSVPYGFDTVSYLRADGQQWIDSLVKLTNNSYVECKFSDAYGTDRNDNFPFGTRTAFENKGFCLTVPDIWFGYGNTSVNKETTMHEGTLIANRNQWTLGSVTHTFNDSAFETDSTCLVFALRNGSSIDSRLFKGNIHSFLIKGGANKCQLNFIPVVTTTGTACMFDTVSRKCFHNKGTGNFSFDSTNYLPRQYKRLPYIESTGFQYIDTEVALSNNHKVEIIYTILSYDDGSGGSADWTSILGARDYSINKSFVIFNNKDTCFRFDYNANSCTVNNTISAGEKIHIIKDGQQNIINNVTVTPNSQQTFTCSKTAYLFGVNDASLTRPQYISARNRLFSCKIWHNGELVRNFIPCLDENDKPCLFDTVDQRCFYNKGVGDFAYPYQTTIPSDYTEVEYLRNTGSAYIDTGIVADAETRFDCVIKKDTNANRALFGAEPKNGTDFCVWTASDKKVWLRIGNESRFIETENYQDVKSSWSFGGFGMKRDGVLLSSWSTNPNCVHSALLFAVNANYGWHFYGSFYRASFYRGDECIFNGIPCLDPTGAPCLFDVISQRPFYSIGANDFSYPAPTTTYSLRSLSPTFAKMTDTGLRRLYHTPHNYEGSLKEYAKENGFKTLIETVCPNEDGKEYNFRWVESQDSITLEWFEREVEKQSSETEENSSETEENSSQSEENS